MARVCARLIFVVLAYGTNAAHGQPFLRRTAASSRRLLEGNEYNDEPTVDSVHKLNRVLRDSCVGGESSTNYKCSQFSLHMVSNDFDCYAECFEYVERSWYNRFKDIPCDVKPVISVLRRASLGDSKSDVIQEAYKILRSIMIENDGNTVSTPFKCQCEKENQVPDGFCGDDGITRSCRSKSIKESYPGKCCTEYPKDEWCGIDEDGKKYTYYNKCTLKAKKGEAYVKGKCKKSDSTGTIIFIICIGVIGASMGVIIGIYIFCRTPLVQYVPYYQPQPPPAQFGGTPDAPYFLDKTVPAATTWQDNDKMVSKTVNDQVEENSREKRLKRIALLAKKKTAAAEKEEKKKLDDDSLKLNEVLDVDGVTWKATIDRSSGELYWYSEDGQTSWTKPEPKANRRNSAMSSTSSTSSSESDSDTSESDAEEEKEEEEASESKTSSKESSILRELSKKFETARSEVNSNQDKASGLKYGLDFKLSASINGREWVEFVDESTGKTAYGCLSEANLVSLTKPRGWVRAVHFALEKRIVKEEARKKLEASKSRGWSKPKD